MRHFFLFASPPSALTHSVVYRAAEALLVSVSGPSKAFAPANLRTGALAVTVATVATPADAHLLGAAPAVIQPIALLVCLHHSHPWYWTTPRIAGIKALQTCPYKRVTAEGPGFFPGTLPGPSFIRRMHVRIALARYRRVPRPHHVGVTFTTDPRSFRRGRPPRITDPLRTPKDGAQF